MSYSLGVDIGSVNVKLALIEENGGVVQLDTEKITSSPRVAVASLLSRLSQNFELESIATAAACGSGRAVIPQDLNWSEYSSSLSTSSFPSGC